jgi:hypothetical protein
MWGRLQDPNDPDERVDVVDGVEFESYFDLFTLSEKQMHEITFMR